MAFERLSYRIRMRARSLVRRDAIDRELDEELRYHVEMKTEENIAKGMTRKEARRAALVEAGGIDQAKERCRETRGIRWMEDLVQDLRFALRMFRKNPGFTAIAVASLALGIGANTATFTLAKAVLLDTLPVSHADELRLLAWTQDQRSAVRGTWGDFYSDDSGGQVTASFSYPVYQQLRQNKSLGDLVAFNVEGGGFDRMTATIDGHAETVIPELVSGNYFQALEVGVQTGRAIEPVDDGTPGSGAVAVISDAFWTRRFGRSPSVVGKSVDLNLTPFTIIGVAPPGFAGASHAQVSSDVFLPLSMQPVIFPREEKSRAFNPSGDASLLDNPKRWWVQIMGRVQPDVSEQAARASLDVTVNQAVRATMTVSEGQTTPALKLLPGSRGGLNYAAHDLERPIALLLSLAGLVLLVACANIANLLLVRSAGRRRELSMRLTLGAGRARLMRQVLTESLMLSLFGGTAGLLLGYFGRDVMSALLSTAWGPSEYGSRFDWRVFAFTLTISVATGLCFGLGPAWQASRTSVNTALKEGAANVAQGGRGLAGKALVVAQVSLCVLLLVAAGLFVRTLANLRSVNPGIQANGLLLFGISPPKQRYPAPKDIEVLHELEQRIEAVPGVVSVTLSGQPLIANSTAGGGFFPDDQPAKSPNENQALSNFVGANFFATMRMPLLSGRGFSSTDTATSPKVAIVNQTLARKFFAGMNPVGETFRRSQADDERYEIIGVSADAKYGRIREDPRPIFYTLFLQEKTAFDGMTFEVRTQGDPLSSAGVVRSAVQSVDHDLPLIDVRTQVEQIDATIAPERIFATVTSGFGILALTLASIGVYGVMAYTVARRINEIGVRMALGAQRSDILRLIFAQGMLLTVCGLVLGLAGAFGLARLLAAMLYGITPADPATYAGVSALLLVVSFVACYAPARRAMRVDPMVALRHQ
jgi:predicted permease